MTTQPEALRLAEWWEQQSHNHALTPESKTATELRRLHSLNQELLEALEKLARLGNGDHFGNSDGNMIARAAIAKAVWRTE